MDTRYRYRIGERWYARMLVPRHLRKESGRNVFQKSLGTADLAEARRRRWDVHRVANEQFDKATQRLDPRRLRINGYDEWRERLKD